MSELFDAVFDVKTLTEILNEGADIDEQRSEDDATPLFVAVDNNLPDSVALLVEHDADPSIPNKDEVTPLQLAAREGYFECAKQLVDGGADPYGVVNLDDKTPIDVARDNGHHDIVDMLSGGEASNDESDFDEDLDDL